MKLEDALESAFQEYNIDEPYKGNIIDFLEMIRNNDPATYDTLYGSVILSSRVARFMHLDPKPALYGGVLHDVGKSTLDPELLRKGDNFY